jgi:micrococcal nuclease
MQNYEPTTKQQGVSDVGNIPPGNDLGRGKETPVETSGYDRATVLVESGNGSGADRSTGNRGELTKIMNKKLIYPALIIIGLFFLVGCVAKPDQTGIKQESIQVQSTQGTSSPDVANTETKPTETPQHPQNDLYKVIKVTDGDTIKVDINGKTETLRLIGIDTPETVDPRKPVQCFAQAASDKAKEILSGKNVRLEADSTQGELDKYNRLLRYVFLEDGTFYNKLMIAEGYAHEYTYQSNPYKYQADFKEAEKQAREQSKGLWSSNTCNGDTTKPADSLVTTTSTTTPITNQENTSEPQVKKSTTGICHEKGISAYYKNTKNFTPYDTIADCLSSGGRLPKKY